MPYARQPAHPGPRRPTNRAAETTVRQRAQAGEPCWFWLQPGYEDCPGGWDWQLHHNHPLGYTTHHLHRLMDGGDATPQAEDMAPAHRRCNARDGLKAQNARRSGRHLTSHAERTRRPW
jgi:hypothetical protein